MKTNDLKKGTQVLLRNGWKATIEDNKKGNTRVCTVYGDFTEAGSVYSHDIMRYRDVNGNWHDVEHTDAQKKLKKVISNFV